MASDKPVIMLDSCVLIDTIQKTPGRYCFIEPYVKEAEAGKLFIVLSVVSLAEVCYLKERHKEGVSMDDQIREIEEWLDREYIRTINVDRRIARRAARLRSPDGSNLKTPDAIVVATALVAGVPKLFTFDGAGRRSGLLQLDQKIEGSPPLRIASPDGNVGPLFGRSDEETASEEEGQA